MKTSVKMLRPLLKQTIRQDSKTGMLSINDFEIIANKHRASLGLTTKRFGDYFKTKEAKEFIEELCREEGLTIDEVKKATRGRGASTWVHPILFVDLALWYSPQLKVKVLKWVYDNLIVERNNSGDSYKLASAAIKEHFIEENSNDIMKYKRMANMVAEACGVDPHDKDKWQTASEEQLRLRDRIHNNINVLAEYTPNLAACVNAAIKKSLV